EVLPLTGGRSASAVLRERLTAGVIVPLVADRDLSASGIPVQFFGDTAKVPAGPAMLAALTDSYLCPTNLSFTGGAGATDGWSIHIHPPMTLPGTRLSEQVRGGAQEIVQHFEQGIGEHPADWHMLQPLWLADLAARRPGAAS
ncbi:MAG: phosphatidylinositol mannoside acyltransferase, partial [Nakamurella sp.]